MKAMVLAAGRGERLRPLTDHTPKPLLEVQGKPLIVHQLESLAAAKIRDVVVNVSYKSDQIQKALGDGARFNLRIHYSVEGGEALGTGGGILKALPVLGEEPFIVTSADIWTNFNYQSLPKVPVGLAHLVMVDPLSKGGDFSLVGRELRRNGGNMLTYANIGVFRPSLFSGSRPGRFPLGQILRQAIDQRRVTGEYFSGEWMNVTTVLDYQRI